MMERMEEMKKLAFVLVSLLASAAAGAQKVPATQ
jgi:hypothetical protein